jgi:cytochrome c oxidase subunit II
MWSDLPLFPDKASTIAGRVDDLYFFLVSVAAFFSILIFAAVFFFAVKYRRRSPDERPKPISGSLKLETLWSVIPFILTMIMFGWGATLYFRNARAPLGTVEVYVVGKQWMWKLQHPEGPREINELHVPIGVPVRLIMTSEDVIHSFFVPAFRIKQDVLPGRYTTMWFQPTRPGKYHLFCAEYCGNQHSGMIGWIDVMTAADYQAWLTANAPAESMAAAGQALYQRLDCGSCHTPDGQGRGPVLQNLIGQRLTLESGQSVVADEDYVRESILNPRAKVVAGYGPIMPTYQGQVTEEQVTELLAYIKSLRQTEPLKSERKTVQ